MVYHESVTGRPARVRQNILISCDFSCRDFTRLACSSISRFCSVSAARVRPSLSEASGKDIDGVLLRDCHLSSSAILGAQTPWPAPDSGTACTMLQPQHHQSGTPPTSPSAPVIRREPTAVVLIQLILGCGSGSNISVQRSCVPPDGLLAAICHLRPAGCAQPAVPVHGCLARAGGNLRPLSCASGQCHFITCCRHKACRGRHRSGGHIAKVPATRRQTSAPAGFCHIIKYYRQHRSARRRAFLSPRWLHSRHPPRP